MKKNIRKFATGSQRSNTIPGTSGKHEPRFDLVSIPAIRRIASTYCEGATKYGVHNWRKGMPFSELINRSIAHTYAYLSGDRTEDHLAHACWNLMAIMEFEVSKPKQNDLYK